MNDVWVWIGLTCYFSISFIVMAYQYLETCNDTDEKISKACFWPVWLVIIFVKTIIVKKK